MWWSVKLGRREKVIHAWGMMAQHSKMEPGARRQELQWSMLIMGMCEVTSVGGKISRDG